MKIQEIAITKIKPYEKNPRRNDAAVDAVAASIREFGWKQPIVVDPSTMEIIAGHTRYKAAKKLGLSVVPCVMADDLSPAQIKAYRLADNKTAELAEWDFDLLDEELGDIAEIDMSEFRFDCEMAGESDDDYEKKKAEFRERMEAGELSEDSDEYQECLRKFETKKTTDDCYTPENIYEVVADYVAEKYGVKKADFVRPFYPGGDYQKENYKPSSVVVDNPPFSIISEICRWYSNRGIRFFMFAPTLTIISILAASKVIVGAQVVYENGANVNTSFVTNMDEFEARSAPDLRERLDEANDANLRAIRKEMPKYCYPIEVMRQTDFAQLSKYGQFFGVKKEECRRVPALDSQKESGKAIFSGGYLISERAAAERAAAERAAAERAAAERAAATTWAFSAREREIIKSLR